MKNRAAVVLGLLSLLLSAAFAGAMPSPYNVAQKTVRDDGRNPAPFSVTCSSTAWSVVQSSDAIRRSLFIMESADSMVSVCLSSATMGANCTHSTPGLDLAPGASLTFYDTAKWYCECYTGANSCYLKGVNERDRGDYDAISDPLRQ